jgi:hypothetical protein
MGRTSPCGRPEANTRLDHARKYLEVADLVAAEGDEIPASASVAASLTVLADIAAAADAACCAALGLRSRGQDHQQAIDLVAQVQPGGGTAAKALARLLDLKDTAEYGVIHISARDTQSALRASATLTKFATDVIRQ